MARKSKSIDYWYAQYEKEYERKTTGKYARPGLFDEKYTKEEFRWLIQDVKAAEKKYKLSSQQAVQRIVSSQRAFSYKVQRGLEKVAKTAEKGQEFEDVDIWQQDQAGAEYRHYLFKNYVQEYWMRHPETVGNWDAARDEFEKSYY